MDHLLHKAAPPQGGAELSEERASLKLKDGRALGFRPYGPKDGVLTFYFHGVPGSRLGARLAPTPGMRPVAVDRPGYGLSTPFPGRGPADWPTDIAALTNYLGFKRFALLGISGGAPCGLACARYLADRISSVAIVCGVGPPGSPGMDGGTMRMLLRIGRHRISHIPLVELARLWLCQGDAEKRFLEFRRRMIERLAADSSMERTAASDAVEYQR